MSIEASDYTGFYAAKAADAQIYPVGSEWKGEMIGHESLIN